MGRAFVDAVASRNHLLVASTDFARGLAVLPNGDPLWSIGTTSTNPIGSELPSGFDGITHDWEVGFWIRTSSPNGAFSQSVYLAISYPSTLANPVFKVVGNVGPGFSQLNIIQYQTNGTSAYRSTNSDSGLNQNTSMFYSWIFPVGASPKVYQNLIERTTSVISPTGTPMAVTGSHRFMMCPSVTTIAMSKGYLFNRILTVSERARLYSSMLAA